MKRFPFFPLAAKRFWIQIAPWWTHWVPTQWMWRRKLCEWRHFWCTPLFLTRFLSLGNKGVYQKCLSSSYPHSSSLFHLQPPNLSHASLCTHTYTPTSLAYIKPPQQCDKLHLNVESVEGLFLSAGSCQKPCHVTVPNARESQNHNLKTIYRWNVVILRWLGGENDCRSSQSSKLENHASSRTNKIISQRASEMKPDFSLESQRPFSLLRENSGALFFSLWFPSSLFFPIHLHLQSVSDQRTSWKVWSAVLFKGIKHLS